MPERDRTTTVLLVLMLAGAASVGLWAALAPQSFYDDFPGGGHHWISADGPFNEHLVRDVGNLFLGLAVVAALALVKPVRELVVAVCAGFIVNGVLHLAYHLRHLDLYDSADKAANAGSLTFLVVVPAVLLWWTVRGSSHRAATAPA